MSVRKFPQRRHKNRGTGWCTWCGLAVEKPARTWHKDCFRRYQLHTDPLVQRAFVADRDGNKCWDCDALPTHWKKGANTIPHHAPYTPNHVGAYCPLERAYALELEHDVPLWKVRGLPERRRRWYFGVWNLRLRCNDCHREKSRRESGERAALKRSGDRGGPAGRPREAEPSS